MISSSAVWRDRLGWSGPGVVVLAVSRGALEALTGVLSALPEEFPAPILVVRHASAGYPSRMPGLLGRRTELAVEEAAGGGFPRPGTVHLAPPGRHLLVDTEGRFALSDAPKEQFVRPAADVLFRSVAGVYGGRVLAAVLTGSGADGSSGVRAVKEAGGSVIAQEPAGCEAPGMPRAALASGSVDYTLPLEKIPAALVSLTMVPWAFLPVLRAGVHRGVEGTPTPGGARRSGRGTLGVSTAVSRVRQPEGP